MAQISFIRTPIGPINDGLFSSHIITPILKLIDAIIPEPFYTFDTNMSKDGLFAFHIINPILELLDNTNIVQFTDKSYFEQSDNSLFSSNIIWPIYKIVSTHHKYTKSNKRKYNSNSFSP